MRMFWYWGAFLIACGGSTSSVGDVCSSNNDCKEDEVCDVASSGVCEPNNVCGNGNVEGDEECDDGDALAGDGCDTTCLFEKNTAGATCEFHAQCESDVCLATQCFNPIRSEISDHAPVLAFDASTQTVVAAAANSGVRVYTLAENEWVLQATLTASNGEDFDNFGESVDISGDTIVVGASGEDGDAASTLAVPNNNRPSAGAAYVFTRSGTTWTEQAYLKAFNADFSDQFGMRVRVDGDTIAVATGFEGGDASSTVNSPNDNLSDAGAVYVFVRDGNNWTPQAYLKAANAGDFDYFGFGLGLEGDTVVVGAPGEDGSTGAAYVFQRTGTTWSQAAYLKASTAQDNDNFGDSVDVSDGSLVVGASVGNDSRGAVYVFSKNGDSWAQSEVLRAMNGDPSDQFGLTLGIHNNAVIVSAQLEDGDINSTVDSPNNNSESSGAAYLFIRSNGSWKQKAYLKSTSSGPGENFGLSAAIDAGYIVVAQGIISPKISIWNNLP